jgi:hypothetical protein
MTKDLEHLLSEGRGKLLHISRELVLDCIVTKEQETTRIARVSLPDDDYEMVSLKVTESGGPEQ